MTDSELAAPAMLKIDRSPGDGLPASRRGELKWRCYAVEEFGLKIAPYKGDRSYIFISYSHRDRAEVLGIIEGLVKKNCRIWYDEGIDPGTEWDDNIATHVEG